jgi:hypothetical protein
MTSNPANNMYAGIKWWLLKNGRTVSLLGVLLFVILGGFIISCLIYSESSILYILLLIDIFLILWVIYLGSGYSSIYEMVRKLSHVTVEDFNPVNIRVVVKDVKNRKYTISYHIFFPASFTYPTYRSPSEHYKIWTLLKGLDGCYYKSIYGFTEYVRSGHFSLSSKQREIVFDEGLMKICSHLHDQAKAISSLRFVGFARQRWRAYLLAMLTEYANSAEIERTIKLLGILGDEIDHYEPESLYPKDREF